jgi:hypothetical protein
MPFRFQQRLALALTPSQLQSQNLNAYSYQLRMRNRVAHHGALRPTGAHEFLRVWSGGPLNLKTQYLPSTICENVVMANSPQKA